MAAKLGVDVQATDYELAPEDDMECLSNQTDPQSMLT